MDTRIEDYIRVYEYTSEINIDIEKAYAAKLEVEEYLTKNKIEDKMLLLKIHHLLALTNYRVNLYNESIANGLKSLEYANELNNKHYAARAYAMMCINYILLENNKELMNCYVSAERIFKELNSHEDLVRLNARVAVYMFRKRKSGEEIRIYLDKALNDINKFHSPRSPQLYITIGSTYSLVFNEYDIALDLFYRALDISRYYNDVSMEALLLYYIAMGYSDMKMIDEAVDVYSEILLDSRFYQYSTIRLYSAFDYIRLLLANKIKLKLIDKLLSEAEKEVQKLDYLRYEQFIIQLNLLKVQHNIEVKKDNIEESLNILDTSSKLYNKHKDNCVFAYIDFYLEQLYGDAYFALGKYAEAAKHHNESLKISQIYKCKHTMQAYQSLIKDYEALSDYKKAYEYSTELNKLIINVENSNLLTKYSNIQRNYEKLKSVEKEREDFFANLSHELKTPINIIYSSIQLMNLFKDKSDKNFKEYYLKHEKSVRINCLRMLKIVHNMIDINKIDCGIITPKFTNYNIVSLIEEITLSVLSSVEVKNINIIFDTEEEEINIKCDPYMIERIILNLLSNAIKFSKENGNIYVNIYTKGSYVVIRVEDDGIGIPDNMKENIFNKFVQIDKTFKRKNEGSGIGLSLVKSIVDIHNGYIKLDSMENVGSIFRIYLPNIQVKDDEESENNDYDVNMERVVSELSDIYDLY